MEKSAKKYAAQNAPHMRRSGGGDGDVRKAEPASGVPVSAGIGFLQEPIGAQGIQGGDDVVLQEQNLRIVEAAHAGHAVLSGGDDAQEGVVGAVFVGDKVVRAGGGPGAQEGLGVVAQGVQMGAGQVIFAAADDGPELLLRDAAGGHLQLQLLAPHTAQGIGHGGVVVLQHIEVFQKLQVGAAVVAGLVQQVIGLGAEVGVLLGVVGEDGAIDLTVGAFLAAGDAGRDDALCRNGSDAGQLSQLVPVDDQMHGLPHQRVHQRFAIGVEQDGVGAKLRDGAPVLGGGQGFQLGAAQGPEGGHAAAVIQGLGIL